MEFIYGAFDALTGLFDWVRIKKNVGKTVRIIFQHLGAVRTHLEEAQEHRMTGAGMIYQDHQNQQFRC